MKVRGKRGLSISLILALVATMVPSVQPVSAAAPTGGYVANKNSTTLLEAENFSSNDGGRAMSDGGTSGGQFVGDFFENNWLGFDISKIEAGNYTALMRVATERENGKFELSVDDTIVAEKEFSGTGSWGNYKLISVPLTLGSDTKQLKITNKGNVWNLDAIYLVGEDGRVARDFGTRIEAENYTFNSNNGEKVMNDGNASGEKYVGDFFENVWLSYDISNIKSGNYLALVRVATEQEEGKFEILVDDQVVGTGEFTTTGGWQNYKEIRVPLTIEAGAKSLKIVNKKNTWNLDYIYLVELGTDAFENVGVRVEAENYLASEGAISIFNEGAASKGKHVGDYDEGESLTYGLYVEDAGSYRFNFSVAVPNDRSAGAAVLSIDGKQYSGSFSQTGGWQNYDTMSFLVDMEKGYHEIKVVNTKGTWNFDYMDICWDLFVEPINVQEDATTVWAANNIADYSRTIVKKNEDSAYGSSVSGIDAGRYVSYRVNAAKRGVYELKLKTKNAESIENAVSISSNGNEGVMVSLNKSEGVFSESGIGYIFLEEGVQDIVLNFQASGWVLDELSLSYTKVINRMGYAYASSEKEGFEASRAIDLVKENDDNAWVAENKENARLGVRFLNAYEVDEVSLYDISDLDNQITKAKLHFSDGSSIDVDALNNDGTKTAFTFEPKTVTWVELEILETSAKTTKTGLAEMEIGGVKASGENVEDLSFKAFVKTKDGWEKAEQNLSGIVSADNTLSVNFDKERGIKKFVFNGFSENIGNRVKGQLALADGTKKDFDVIVDETTKSVAIEFEEELYSDSYVFTFEAEGAVSVSKMHIYGSFYSEGQNVDTSSVILRNYWKNTEVLAIKQDGSVGYVDTTVKNYDDSGIYWNIEKSGDYFTLKNNKTGGYVTIEDPNAESPVCVENGADTLAGKWKNDAGKNESYRRIVNAMYTDKTLQVEAQNGKIQIAGVPAGYQSSWWTMEPSTYFYELKDNKVVGSNYRAIANDGTSITSNRNGNDSTWTLTEDISGSPIFKAPNTPLLEAVYNLSMEEAYLNMFEGKYGTVFRTGTDWPKVWTRDTAMSCEYVLANIFPEISKNCALEKVVGEEGSYTYEQDTGTGGAYPVSVDRVITLLSAWEIYLTTGDEEFLEEFYEITENTINQDFNVCFDLSSGLFKGETGGLDHRDKTYPDWMSENYKESLANIAEGKSAIVNIIYCEVFNIMNKSARILGKGEETENMWAALRDDLKTAIGERLWSEDLGMYASWEYPEYMGSPLAYKADVISNGYALWFDIGTEEQLKSIEKNYPLVTFGAPTVYPQKNGQQSGTIYHNRGVWPGWEAVMMLGAQHRGNYQISEEIWNSCITGAASLLTNQEVINFTTGAGSYSRRQLWSIAGTLSGYYKVLYGMVYGEDGISFNPYVPEWMNGPFTLENFKYRDAIVDFTLNGTGDTVTSIKLDGKEVGADYVLPTNTTGHHTMEITLKDSGKRSEMNLSDEKNHVTCPDLPQMKLENGVLTWNEDSDYTYKLWNGKEYLAVSGGRYEIKEDAYAAYSLVAVDKNGICSEMSRPIVVNAIDGKIVIEAEDCDYADGKFKNSIGGYSGTGYVEDKRVSTAPISMEVEIEKAGTYLFSSIHSNNGDSTTGDYAAIRSVYVDGKDVGSLVFPAMKYDYQTSTHLAFGLGEGKHVITLLYDDENWYDRNMNKNRNDVLYDAFVFELVKENQGETPDTPPTEEPGETPDTPPTEEPGETPDTPPTEEPGETPDTPPTEEPGETPDTPPTDNPGDDIPTGPSDIVGPVDTTGDKKPIEEVDASGNLIFSEANTVITKVGTVKKVAASEISGNFYDAEGKKLVNAIVISKDERYILDEKGEKIVSSIVKTANGTLYITKADGTVARGSFVTVGDKKYYTTKSTGKFITNKVFKVKGKKYIAGKNGSLMKSCWVTIKGKKYYCSKSGVVTNVK